MKKALFIIMAMGLLAAPALASENENETDLSMPAEEVISVETEDEEVQKLHGDTECELNDGVFTVRIKALDTDDKDFHWETWKGDKGDASFVDLITETDQEEGLAYAGSFFAIEDEGDDVIRLVHTNGFYIDEYMEFNVKVEGGKITETTGGSQAYGATGEDLAPVLAGKWQEVGGPRVMKISVSKDNALDFVISDTSREEASRVYTMTAYFDCVLNALLYQNCSAASSNTQEEVDAIGEQQGQGTGLFGFITDDENPDPENLALVWHDETFGNMDCFFVKAE